MFRELDWRTPSSKMDIVSHWRLLICLLVGSILATIMWHKYFPHTFWFEKLWAGMATGFIVGMIPGTIWQLHEVKRRRITSGWFTVTGFFAWGLFACISLLLMAPDMSSQEQERSKIRSLAAADISAITVELDGQRIRIEDADSIASFVSHAKRAELFYPSHEVPIRELEITIHLSDNTLLHYDGGIPERHPRDISIDFFGYFVWRHIIIPGGEKWLDSISR